VIIWRWGWLLDDWLICHSSTYILMCMFYIRGISWCCWILADVVITMIIFTLHNCYIINSIVLSSLNIRAVYLFYLSEETPQKSMSLCTQRPYIDNMHIYVVWTMTHDWPTHVQFSVSRTKRKAKRKKFIICFNTVTILTQWVLTCQKQRLNSTIAFCNPKYYELQSFLRFVNYLRYHSTSWNTSGSHSVGTVKGLGE